MLKLTMDKKQEKPSTGWEVLPHARPLTVNQCTHK